ncbi:MAG: acyl carrier protein [Phycisphaerales bacterium]
MPSVETLVRVKTVLRSCLKVDGNTPLDDAMPLVGGEYDMDSLDILLLVTELEKEFGVKIREATMDKGTFSSVATLGDYIETLPVNR